MTSDLPAALLCQTIYQNAAYFDKIFNIAGVYIGYKFFDGKITLVGRGSLTAHDWFISDLRSIETTEHPVLGTVGSGFIEGVDEVYAGIKASIAAPVGSTIVITAHSLGCSHAQYLAGLFIGDGHTVELPIFAPPRACGPKLISMLAPYALRPYCNSNDGVTVVPFELEQARELIPLNCPPVTGDLEPLNRHHMQLYCTGLALKEGAFL